MLGHVGRWTVSESDLFRYELEAGDIAGKFQRDRQRKLRPPQNAGTASAFTGTGNTHGGSRFDYVFYSRVAAFTLSSVTVPDTRINEVYPSDHDPVIAVFQVN